MTEPCLCTLDSPIGLLLLSAEGDALTGIFMGAQRQVMGQAQPSDTPILCAAREQLAAYFAGTLQEFSLTLDARGTPFQRRVWDALLRIPFGTTDSYGALAQRLGDPQASRAVGLANGRNPIPIVIPCHRVIGSNGALTGYGGGIERKRWLLAHEAQNVGLRL